MLLVIDVGNTNLVVGVYEGKTLVQHWRMATDRSRTTDEYDVTMMNLFLLSQMSPQDVKCAIISSVVPPLNPVLERVCERYFHAKPLVVGPGIKTGISIQCDNPREVGADRIVNAVAAYERFGGPIIVIDFGTATTFCAINDKGMYLGGAIAPGMGIATEALFERAAKLPRIAIKKTDQVICKNTVASMQAGVLYGYVGLVEGLVTRMKKELSMDAKVIATGGLAPIIAGETACIDHIERMLTLEGLRLIYEKNK